MADNSLQIVIEAKDEASATFEKVQKSSQNLGDQLGDFGKKVLPGVTLGFAGVVAVVGSSIKAFTDSQDASRKLGFALKASGEFTQDAQGKLEQYAAELQDLTGISDEAIQSTEALLVTMGAAPENLKRATAVTLDLSTALGVDLDSAAKRVALALGHPEEALGKLRSAGIFFSDSQEEIIKKMVEVGNLSGAQEEILKSLEEKYKGAAEAAGSTFSGQLDKLKENFNDLQETLGKGFLDQLTNSIGGMDQFTKMVETANSFLQNNADVLQLLTQGFLVLGAVLAVIIVVVGFLTGSVVIITAFIASLIFIIFAAVIALIYWRDVWVQSLTEMAASVQLMVETTLLKIRDWEVKVILSIMETVERWKVYWGEAGKYVVDQFKAMYDGAVQWLGKIGAFFDGIIQKARDIGNVIGGAVRGSLPKFQYGGFVDTTGLAVLHAGEYVVSNDMQQGRAPSPAAVTNNYSQPITINATGPGEPDWDALSYRIGFILRNQR